MVFVKWTAYALYTGGKDDVCGGPCAGDVTISTSSECSPYAGIFRPSTGADENATALKSRRVIAYCQRRVSGKHASNDHFD